MDKDSSSVPPIASASNSTSASWNSGAESPWCDRESQQALPVAVQSLGPGPGPTARGVISRLERLGFVPVAGETESLVAAILIADHPAPATAIDAEIRLLRARFRGVPVAVAGPASPEDCGCGLDSCFGSDLERLESWLREVASHRKAWVCPAIRCLGRGEDAIAAAPPELRTAMESLLAEARERGSASS